MAISQAPEQYTAIRPMQALFKRRFKLRMNCNIFLLAVKIVQLSVCRKCYRINAKNRKIWHGSVDHCCSLIDLCEDYLIFVLPEADLLVVLFWPGARMRMIFE